MTKPGERRSFYTTVSWAYAMNWGEKGFNAVFTLVLAALVGPRDFGILAIALVYIAFVQMFLDQGLSAALIQRPQLEPEHLDSVFWINLLFSVALMGVTLGLAAFQSGRNRELALVISALSFCVPLEGLAIVQRAVLQKELDFKNLSIRANGSVLVAGVVGVTLALSGLGLWALVAQQLLRDVASLILLWAASPWRPRRNLSWRHIRELLHFSSANFMAKLGVFVNTQCDALIIGMFWGPVPVGLYRLADKMVSTITDFMTNSLQAVSFPQFSRVQSDPAALRSSVVRFVRLSATITVPAMAGLLVTSRDILAIMGGQWAPAVYVLRVLCVVGLVQAFTAFTGPLLQSVGRPGRLAVIHWAFAAVWLGVLLAFGLALRYAGIDHQIAGLAMARLLMAVVIMGPVMVVTLAIFGRVSLASLARASTSGALAAGAIVGSAYLVYSVDVFSGASSLVRLMVMVAVGVVAWAVTILLTDSEARRLLANVLHFMYDRADKRVVTVSSDL